MSNSNFLFTLRICYYVYFLERYASTYKELTKGEEERATALFLPIL